MSRIALFSAAALSAASLAPGTAEARVDNLMECFRVVVSWCEARYPEHADACASAPALDACVAEFGNGGGRPQDRMRIVTAPALGNGLPPFFVTLGDPTPSVRRLPAGGPDEDERAHVYGPPVVTIIEEEPTPPEEPMPEEEYTYEGEYEVPN